MKKQVLSGLIGACVLMTTVVCIGGLHAYAQTTTVNSGADERAFETTVSYVEHFYPLWFSQNQSRRPPINRIVGPNRISPIYQSVVAINNDTLYASAFLDVSVQPVILIIPTTTARYSMLMLDGYGDIFPTVIHPPSPGTFLLHGPEFKGTIPSGVTDVPLPFDYMMMIFRADKFTNGVDMTAAADTFRRKLHTQPLCAYLGKPCPSGTFVGGYAKIVPELGFAIPLKTITDSMIRLAPIKFLSALQAAVASPRTPPMSPEEKQLSDSFNELFASARENPSPFAKGARTAHDAILTVYLEHTGPTNWINFNNFGHWTNDQFLERSSITEFLQYGNDYQAAAYYHAFLDGSGSPLIGADPKGYVLTFPANNIPQAERFWSVTAYTPESIELVSNSAHKYEVASYTRGLKTIADGSISIYMATALPSGVPMANWLPIPRGSFNVMLRVYGPKGSVANETFVPPGIVKVH
jgi:hypothetical protein